MTNDHKHEFFAVENIEKSNFNTKSTLQFLSSLKIDNISQIREQMCLKMNVHSWAVLGSRGCREKKIQTAISMQLLSPVFFTFSWEKILILRKLYPSVCTENLKKFEAQSSIL